MMICMVHIRLAPRTQVYKKNPHFENPDRAVQKIEVVACTTSASCHLRTTEISLTTPHGADAMYLQPDSGASSTANNDDIHPPNLATQPDQAGASYGMEGSSLQSSRPIRTGSKRRPASCIQCG